MNKVTLFYRVGDEVHAVPECVSPGPVEIDTKRGVLVTSDGETYFLKSSQSSPSVRVEIEAVDDFVDEDPDEQYAGEGDAGRGALMSTGERRK